MDRDPFEESLRELLQEPSVGQPSEQALERVLRTANRQTGAGALLLLSGRALESIMMALEGASAHWRPVSRLTGKTTDEHKE
ncbi:MAG: CrfX protein [Gammaproteobacteria bacterium]|jgi:hypothetical protein|nr:CrfX protein [Gammaproteobacteria bacterium]